MTVQEPAGTSNLVRLPAVDGLSNACGIDFLGDIETAKGFQIGSGQSCGRSGSDSEPCPASGPESNCERFRDLLLHFRFTAYYFVVSSGVFLRIARVAEQ
jgi:hypothetical protein